jgi:bifunctional non-homologous end joining protein LigD
MTPTLAKAPPVGDEWVHEVKFDGWRAQVHVDDGEATIYSRNGADLSKRFRALKPIIGMIPARSAIRDCELVACGEYGLPCFRTLMDHRATDAPLCLWAFDLLHLDGVRLTPLPLAERKERLADLTASAPISSGNRESSFCGCPTGRGEGLI